jgi:hypothetical protein
MTSNNIKIQHETFGTLLDENFSNPTQFKLFLKMVNACLESKTNLDFFNGIDFLIHIPYKYLVDSIVLTKNNEYTLTEHLMNKTKIEK